MFAKNSAGSKVISHPSVRASFLFFLGGGGWEELLLLESMFFRRLSFEVQDEVLTF